MNFTYVDRRADYKSLRTGLFTFRSRTRFYSVRSYIVASSAESVQAGAGGDAVTRIWVVPSLIRELDNESRLLQVSFSARNFRGQYRILGHGHLIPPSFESFFIVIQ